MFVLCVAVPSIQAGQTLILNSDPYDYIGGGRRFSFTAADGEFVFQRNQYNGVHVFFHTPNQEHFWHLDFSPPYGQTLAVGTYLDTISFPFPLSDKPGLNVGGDGRGCSGNTGSFEIKQLRYGSGNTVEAFSAVFEQHCSGGTPALHGEIRSNPAVTVTAPTTKTLQVGESLTFTVAATEINVNPLVLTTIALPVGAIFFDNGNNTGTFSWSPAAGQGGIHNVRFHADNGLGDGDSAVTRIAVGDVLRVPEDVATIQGAIDWATDAYTVLVAPGTYVENINFNSKQIIVRSEQGSDVTIIDGNRSAPVAVFEFGEGPESVLSGFTLRNGRSILGGGINIRGASPTLNNNVIVDNEACIGNGISILGGSPVIQGNTISNNRAVLCTGGDGGGIHIGGGSSAQILDNIITENDGGDRGGGISLFSASGATIRGNILTGNSARNGGAISTVNTWDVAIVQNVMTGNRAGSGGGIYWLIPCCAPGPLLVNNTIADNDAEQGSGIFTDGYDTETQLINNIIAGKAGHNAVFCGNSRDQNPPILKSNNIFTPAGPAYGGICANQTGINGNISADPLFLDPASGDYRLDVGSPSIDIGDNTAPKLPVKDLATNNRIVDGDENGQAIIDMGAYEFFPNPGFFEFAALTFSVPENGGSALVTINRRGGLSGQVTVEIAMSDGTATAGSDYIASSATLTFSNGEMQNTLSVPIINDQLFEGKETVNLRLNNPQSGAGLGARQSAVLYITEPGIISFTSPNFSANENSGCAVVTIRRTDGNSGEVTVHYATDGGSATPGIDYVPTSGTLTFADGETTKTVCIPVLSDALVEGTETVNLIISDVTGGALLGNFSSTVLNISGSDFISADYFPADPGLTWKYLKDGAATVDITVLTEPAAINGVATDVFQDASGQKEFYTADSDGIRLHGFSFPRVLIEGLGRTSFSLTFAPPVLLADGVADIGQTATSSGIARTNKLPRIGIIDIPYSANFTVAEFDNITVPAGNFDIVRLQGSLNLSGQPSQLHSFELAEGIGIVRSTITQQGITETLELISTNVAPFTIDTASLPDGEQGVFYRGSLSINGSRPPYSYNIISGSLPAGLTIDDDGNITGTPSMQAKSASFTVRVSQRGSYVTKAFKITILKALRITTASLKKGVSGKNYAATLTASGGKTPYNWSLVSGALPSGLSLNSLTGSVTGVPTELGTFTPAFRVTDSLGGRTEKSFALTIR